VECHEEMPFGIRIASGAVTKLLTGIIDLVYRAGESWCLLDYKTDTHGSDADLRSKYGAQIDAYEKAWGQLTGAKVEATLFPAREQTGSEVE
jgi:ATP-dependent exoDNAse (exonuclease V) beta subunit